MVAAHVSLMLYVNPTPLGYVSMSKFECEAIAVPYLPLCLPSCTLSKMGFGTDLVGICMGTSHPSTYLYSKTRKKQGGKPTFFKKFFILGNPQLQLQITIKYARTSHRSAKPEHEFNIYIYN